MERCENQSIHVIELKNAHDNFKGSFNLKKEMDIVTGIFATAFIPVKGATQLNNFKEEGQFRFAPVSLTFNDCNTTYTIPVHFANIQGYVPGEEKNANYNRQLAFIPISIYKKLSQNASIKVKYRDSIASFRFVHDIKLYLKYIDK